MMMRGCVKFKPAAPLITLHLESNPIKPPFAQILPGDVEIQGPDISEHESIGILFIGRELKKQYI